jgi:hypothetical protein
MLAAVNKAPANQPALAGSFTNAGQRLANRSQANVPPPGGCASTAEGGAVSDCRGAKEGR